MKLVHVPAIFLLFIVAACNETAVTPVVDEQPVDPYFGRYGEKLDHQPFDTELEIESSADKGTKLVIDLTVEEGSFILSHFEEESFMGRFKLDLPENEHILITETLVENAIPEEEYYVWAEREVKKIKGNAIYHQKLDIQTQKDFEVPGTVSFVVEPNCNRFEVAFLIKQRSGVIMVEEIGTEIANI